MTGINLLPYAAPIRSSVCQRTEFPKRTMISGRRIFFLPSPSPLSFFRPRTYRKGYYFYSPQSSTVIKSKMAATTILRTQTRFRPPKIRLHCRLSLQSKLYSSKQRWGAKIYARQEYLSNGLGTADQPLHHEQQWVLQ